MYLTASLRYLLLFATMAGLEAQAPSSLRGGQRDLIISGDAVGPDRHPYFALMNDNGLCGAVLIASKFVLTAAHCVGSDDDFEIGISERLSTLFSGNSDSGGTEYPWTRLVVHPDYNPMTVDSDIAIYELADELPVGSLPPIRLGREPVTRDGTDMTVIGFGDTDPGPASSIPTKLLETTIDYVNTEECEDLMGDTITDGMLCGFRRGEDSCQGDSGGPLFLKGDTIEQDSLIGLVSWGYECAGDTPGVYTRISNYYDWIVETMCFLDSDNVPDYVDCSTIEISGTPDIVNPGEDGGSGFGFDDFFGFGDDDYDASGNDDFWSNLFGSDDDNTDDFWSNLWGSGDDNYETMPPSSSGSLIFNDDNMNFGTTAPSSSSSFGGSFSSSFSSSGFGGDDDTNDDWWSVGDSEGSWWSDLWQGITNWFRGLFGGR